MPGQSVKSMKSSLSTGGGEKFPVSKVDYTQPVIAKNSKVTFDEKLEKAKSYHKERIEDLIYEMDAVKRENNRLRRQQEDTYGVSLDTVERMKKELERAKTTRMFLMEDIELRKAKSEKMEAEIFELNMKLESYTKKINECSRLKTKWNETSEKLQKTEEKVEKLLKVNKNLRMLMTKHHIDPRIVDVDSGRGKRAKKGEKHRSERAGSKPSEPKKRPETLPQSQQHAQVTASKRFRSLTDLRDPSSVRDDVAARAPVSPHKVTSRGSPSYLGCYTDIHHNRMMAKSKIDHSHLPRLVVA